MKKFAITPLLLAMLALHSCAGVPATIASAGSIAVPIVETVVAKSEVVVVRGTQGLIIANEFYQAANRAALVVVRSGVLNRSQLLAVQDANRVATAALVRGKNAKDDVSAAREAAIVMTSGLKLRSAIGL